MTPISINSKAAELAVCVVLAGLVFGAGWAVEGWRKDAEIETLKRVTAEEKAKATAAAAEALAKSVRRGDELAERVAAAETQRDIALQETQNALRKSTTGRPCLNAGTVRLLNNAGPGGNALPATASEFAGADAPAASDTDVALWAAQCRRGYDTCRGRIDALNAFFKD